MLVKTLTTNRRDNEHDTNYQNRKTKITKNKFKKQCTYEIMPRKNGD